MKNVLCSLIIPIIISFSAFACETPEELMDNYFSDFNAQDIIMIERNFSFPLLVIQNGKKTLLFKKDKSSIIQLNFSWINNDWNIYLTSDVNYILIKENEHWYISGIVVDSNIPLGIQNN